MYLQTHFYGAWKKCEKCKIAADWCEVTATGLEPETSPAASQLVQSSNQDGWEVSQTVSLWLCLPCGRVSSPPRPPHPSVKHLAVMSSSQQSETAGGTQASLPQPHKSQLTSWSRSWVWVASDSWLAGAHTVTCRDHCTSRIPVGSCGTVLIACTCWYQLAQQCWKQKKRAPKDWTFCQNIWLPNFESHKIPNLNLNLFWFAFWEGNCA